MIEYSFVERYSNSTKEEARALLETTDKKILYTHGLKFRNPATKDVPVTNEKALELFDGNSTCDVTEHEDYVDLNAYSGNDLW